MLIFSSDLPSYWQNIYVTIVGAIGTVLIIDQRAEQRAIRQRKEELILQMRSQNNDYAIEAARLLWLRGWMADGTLKKADLTLANLKGVGLVRANLSDARLSGANLEDATLWDSNFQYVFWGSANLKKARLTGANLEGTWFDSAKLQSAILSGANLMNATFIRTESMKKPSFQIIHIGHLLQTYPASLTRITLNSGVLRTPHHPPTVHHPNPQPNPSALRLCIIAALH